MAYYVIFDGLYMSITINILTSKYVLQVSDRRLVRINKKGNYTFYTDRASKSIVVVCKDAFFSCSYYGAGEVNGKRTNEWLLDEFNSEKVYSMKLVDLVNTITNKATLWFKSAFIDNGIKPMAHTFIFTGYWNINVPFLFFISNYESKNTDEQSDVPKEMFKNYYFIPKPNNTDFSCVFIGGQSHSVKKQEYDLLLHFAKTIGARPSNVTEVIAKIIRRISVSNDSVSSESMSVLFTPGNRIAKCRYWSENSNQGFLPDYYSQIGIMIKGSEYSFGPDIPLWHIRSRVPENVVFAMLISDLEKIPKEFKVGDNLPKVNYSLTKVFLEKLEKGISIERILLAIKEK
jgi:hypothetical protein